ncbi:hypothetical protein C7S14_6795 [Burkholderia cepacia]|nr:hypothetical protein C7S14_6795 [Burkholderia cepacia]
MFQVKRVHTCLLFIVLVCVQRRLDRAASVYATCVPNGTEARRPRPARVRTVPCSPTQHGGCTHSEQRDCAAAGPVCEISTVRGHACRRTPAATRGMSLACASCVSTQRRVRRPTP